MRCDQYELVVLDNTDFAIPALSLRYMWWYQRKERGLRVYELHFDRFGEIFKLHCIEAWKLYIWLQIACKWLLPIFSPKFFIAYPGWWGDSIS